MGGKSGGGTVTPIIPAELASLYGTLGTQWNDYMGRVGMGGKEEWYTTGGHDAYPAPRGTWEQWQPPTSGSWQPPAGGGAKDAGAMGQQSGGWKPTQPAGGLPKPIGDVTQPAGGLAKAIGDVTQPAGGLAKPLGGSGGMGGNRPPPGPPASGKSFGDAQPASGLAQPLGGSGGMGGDRPPPGPPASGKSFGDAVLQRGHLIAESVGSPGSGKSFGSASGTPGADKSVGGPRPPGGQWFPFARDPANVGLTGSETPGGDGGNTTPGNTTQSASWVPDVSRLPLTGGEWGFWGPTPRNVSGTSPLSDWAAGNVTDLYGSTGEQGLAAQIAAALGGEGAGNPYAAEAADAARRGAALAGTTPTGEGLAENPVIKEAMRVYEEEAVPALANRRSLMGLGRSDALARDISKGQSQMMLPLMESQLGREERGIERGSSGSMALANLLSGMGSQDAATRLQAAGLLGDLGSQDWQQRAAAIGEAQRLGAYGRDVAEQGNEAQYEDFLRRQDLWERLWQIPMGQTPNTIGERTRTSGGGLFK